MSVRTYFSLDLRTNACLCVVGRRVLLLYLDTFHIRSFFLYSFSFKIVSFWLAFTRSHNFPLFHSMYVYIYIYIVQVIHTCLFLIFTHVHTLTHTLSRILLYRVCVCFFSNTSISIRCLFRKLACKWLFFVSNDKMLIEQLFLVWFFQNLSTK